MKTIHITLISIVAVILIVTGSVFGMYVSYNNQEKRLRNMITAKQKDNEQELDNMQKKIVQVAQVTQEQAKRLSEMVLSYADARTSDNQGSLLSMVTEAIPNLPTETYTNLQNVIVGSRNSFTMRQKEILDMKREHDNLLMIFPGSLFLSSKQPIEVKIVTSTRSQKAMESGVDNEIELFK